MTKRAFKIIDLDENGQPSVQARFIASRAKIQVMGGGYGNGKTASACYKALMLAKDYPGSNGLIARSTYPKLNDTIRRELLKWCPKDWIARKPTKDDNTLILKNESTINFRYAAQRSGGDETSSSNLLSATYDWIVVDQIEDPEFVEKDMLDMLGRLRGSTSYVGDDPTMPDYGPNWLIVTCNPTRNWFYRKVVRPLQIYMKTGERHPDLFCDQNGDPIVDLFEGSTYTNKDNLPDGFIDTMEATYKGQMRDRYLMGLWAAYEGLVYPQFSELTHLLPRDKIIKYMRELQSKRFNLEIYEAYDEGSAVPSCYLIGFADHLGNVFIFDGWYESGLGVEAEAQKIKQIRTAHGIRTNRPILADPAVFKKSGGAAKQLGKTTAELFKDEGVPMQRANNDIINGIKKVQSYLNLQQFHTNPVTGEALAPYLYIATELQFIVTEITDYYWKKDTQGDIVDQPRDKNDHAMDTIKYLLTYRPKLATIMGRDPNDAPEWTRWHEIEQQNQWRRSTRRAA